MKIFTTVLSAAALVLLANHASAGTIEVPTDFPTIQAAVDAAVDGDVILVAPGSYLGPSGEGYARLALVPTEEECERAVGILERVL